ncbi:MULTISPECIES: radical SAM protein [Dictyoglomus]|jgi:uncharacterized radical SAM superfamily protein|uniref:Elongator protein 3/MiaB/NifB n=1 Tax=Dictyoglomus turgidum (strain DSM 6724 / Z-1310) TaxID=515635 RepID=B8E2E9_DICTD|nr:MULTISPECIES: radical SAM protein [Dictyoglomus]ACK42793.1 Elongator protein 3/MiaB/NifB [Dictyoglomus turgidum DSM 6724]PNV80999.1 MAG: radical SAM protein [Dictyoglomus turgidum]HBU30852.1 radical SAM protein [Dictyoglomus sp.]
MTIKVTPISTLPISITGDYCALQCDHCKAHFLKNMTPLYLSENKLKKDNNYKSILISGGYNKEGVLPITDVHLTYLKRFKSMGYKLNFHLGLINEEDAKKLNGIPDMVSFDLIFDNFVIKEVFHLKSKNKENFKESFLLLNEHFPVSPHILIGANYGKISKEYEEIEFLEKINPKKLIFIVITPLKNTPFEKIDLPPIKEIEDLWKFAKKKLPNTDLYLGCVRPKGDYRYELDSLALEFEFKAIVNPYHDVMKNLDDNKFDQCCALL